MGGAAGERGASPKSFRSARNGAGITGRYRPMAIRDLCALGVAVQAETGAHLYLWTTNAFMVEAHTVARAWGFTPKTICTWGKVRPDGRRRCGWALVPGGDGALSVRGARRPASVHPGAAADAVAVAADGAFGQAPTRERVSRVHRGGRGGAAGARPWREARMSLTSRQVGGLDALPWADLVRESALRSERMKAQAAATRLGAGDGEGGAPARGARGGGGGADGGAGRGAPDHVGRGGAGAGGAGGGGAGGLAGGGRRGAGAARAGPPHSDARAVIPALSAPGLRAGRDAAQRGVAAPGGGV